MQEFFYMDGKWMYVWSSYAITLIALVLSIVFANSRKKKLLKEIEDSLED
ncbi:MAG: heme exporter protein CcmD [Gammaproteobacteria bacterium]|nr:heme exporter protein CcmD [Gammaproteobacteria bacterium]NNC68617.1 heme exporter protein CcmD [Gammaproteobacteria bacterium]